MLSLLSTTDFTAECLSSLKIFYATSFHEIWYEPVYELACEQDYFKFQIHTFRPRFLGTLFPANYIWQLNCAVSFNCHNSKLKQQQLKWTSFAAQVHDVSSSSIPQQSNVCFGFSAHFHFTNNSASTQKPVCKLCSLKVVRFFHLAK